MVVGVLWGIVVIGEGLGEVLSTRAALYRATAHRGQLRHLVGLAGRVLGFWLGFVLLSAGLVALAVAIGPASQVLALGVLATWLVLLARLIPRTWAEGNAAKAEIIARTVRR